MNIISLINHTIDYIERHLTEAITSNEVAVAAGYSRTYFDRLFLSVTGETPSRYIRKRRLSEAARQLVTSNRSILGIALDYQFQSQEAFTRSFKQMFGLSPHVYRRRCRLRRFYPKLTLSRRKVHRLYGEIDGECQVLFSPRNASQILIVRLSALILPHGSALKSHGPFESYCPDLIRGVAL